MRTSNINNTKVAQDVT